MLGKVETVPDPFDPHIRFPAVAIESGWLHRLFSGRYERDPGFREVVNRLARRGMIRAGWLAIGLVVAFVVLKQLTTEKTIVLWYPEEEGRRVLVMWDKLLIVAMSVLSILLARIPRGVRWGRFVVTVLVTAATTAIVLDDVANSDFHLRYVTLAMILAVGLMPYRPIHTVALCGSLGLASYLSLGVFPPWLGLDLQPTSLQAFVFLFLVTLILTVVSSALYETRYGQYRARRQAEELAGQVREQAEELRRMEALKDQFFANLSHEFRTPLTLIMAPLEDALEGRWGKLRKTAVNRIVVMRRNARRLLTLINELLELSRLDEGISRLVVAERDLVAIGRIVVQSFSSRAERNGVDLSFESGADRIDVFVDQEAIEKVLTNLVSNAVKFTPRGGSVRVKIGPGSDGTVLISVRDTGPGIDPADLDHVFDRFFQGTRPRGDSTPGSGIGLALAAALVHQHFGEIAVTSEPGFGSEFTVTLPLGRDHLGDSVDFADRPVAIRMAEADSLSDEDVLASDLVTADGEDFPGPEEDAPTVLVVDDDDEVREYIAELLSVRYRVLQADDGKEATRIIESDRPDLVISDVMMPGLDGLELCRWVRSEPRLASTPVILVTALAEEESRIEGLRERADDYICKPFSAAELLVRAENLIELRRVVRQHVQLKRLTEPTEVEAPSADQVFLESVRAVVEEHMENSNFTVEWLAEEVHLSSKQLSRKLQKLTSLSAGGFIRMMRLKRAAQLLASHVGNVSEVSYAVGFNDSAHFSRLFKQTFGVTPSEYAAASTDEG